MSATINVGTLEALLRLRDEMTPAILTLSESMKSLQHTMEESAKKAHEAGHGIKEGLEIGAGIELFKALKETLVGTVEHLGQLFEKSVESAHGIEMLSAKAGISTDAAQRLAFAFGTIGEPVEAVTKVFRVMEAQLGSGSTKAYAAAHQLGLDFQKLRNESPDKALNEVAQALSHISNASERAAIGKAMLGRGYQTLLPILDSLIEKEKQAEEVGAIINPEDLQAAAEMGEHVRILGMAWDGLIHNLIDAALNSKLLFVVIDQLTTWIAQMSKWVQANRNEIRSWLSDAIAHLLDAFIVMIEYVKMVVTGLTYMADAWSLVIGGSEALGAAIVALIMALDALAHGSLQGAKDSWSLFKIQLDEIGNKINDQIEAHHMLGAALDRGMTVGQQAVSKLKTAIVGLGNAQEVVKAKTHELTGENNGSIDAVKAAEAAYAKLSVTLTTMWEKVTTSGMSAYDKAQANVLVEGDKFIAQMNKEIAVLEKNHEWNEKTSLDYLIMHDNVEKWVDAMQKVIEVQRQQEAMKTGADELRTATDKYNETLNQLNPTLDRTISIEREKYLHEQNSMVLKLQSLGVDDAVIDKILAMQNATHKLTEEQIRLNEHWRKMNDILDTIGKIRDLLVSMGLSGSNALVQLAGGFIAGQKAAENFQKANGNLAKQIGAVTDAASAAFGSGSVLGGAMTGASFGAQFGPIGAGIGAVAGGLLGLFGHAKKVREEMKKLMDQFLDTFGKNPQEGLANLKKKAEEAKVPLDKLFDAKNAQQLKQAIDDIKDALELHDDAVKGVNDAMQKYGLTIEEMGPKWAKQELDKKAMELLKDYELLTAAGADQVAIITKMGPAINDYVHDCLKAGIAIPENLRPALTKMAEMGELTDANGEKITDVSKLNFTKDLTTQVQNLIQSIKDLVDALLGIPKHVDTKINVQTNYPGAPGANPGIPTSVHPPTQEEIDRMRNEHHAAEGYTGWVSGPTRFLVGEGREREFVSITPESKMGSGGGGGNSGGSAPMTLHADFYMDGIKFGTVVTQAFRNNHAKFKVK